MQNRIFMIPGAHLLIPFAIDNTSARKSDQVQAKDKDSCKSDHNSEGTSHYAKPKT
jgi:hypothetical protein